MGILAKGRIKAKLGGWYDLVRWGGLMKGVVKEFS